MNAMDWLTKVKYLQQNPVPAARQIDYTFQRLMGCVILDKIPPIGRVLNYDERDEFQSRGPEHLLVPVHVKYDPKIDGRPDSEVIEFIDRYITCAIPDKNSYPELYKLVTTVQNQTYVQML